MNITKDREHMTKPKAPQHTSKPKTKNAFLPPLQRKVFLYLANNDPKNINETVKAIKGHYKSSWNAFNGLEKKKLVKIVSSKTYRGQEDLAIGLAKTELLLHYAKEQKQIA